jgi:hypothetical protein
MLNNFTKHGCNTKLPYLSISFKMLSEPLLLPFFFNKTGDPLNPSNYRGIAITSCLSKLFNSILNARLEKYILKKKNLYVMNKLASKQHAEHPTTYLS